MEIGGLAAYVDDGFKERAVAELDAARERCLALLRKTRSDKGGRHRYVVGSCAGCGISWDEETVGCWNCRCRHAGRARLVAAKAADDRADRPEDENDEEEPQPDVADRDRGDPERRDEEERDERDDEDHGRGDDVAEEPLEGLLAVPGGRAGGSLGAVAGDLLGERLVHAG
jgi:hypothetical protein